MHCCAIVQKGNCCPQQWRDRVQKNPNNFLVLFQQCVASLEFYKVALCKHFEKPMKMLSCCDMLLFILGNLALIRWCKLEFQQIPAS